MSCPSCDQGALYRVTFPANGISSYMCDECNTLWLNHSDVGPETGYALHAILKWMGIKEEPGAVEIGERVDWNQIT